MVVEVVEGIEVADGVHVEEVEGPVAKGQKPVDYMASPQHCSCAHPRADEVQTGEKHTRRAITGSSSCPCAGQSPGPAERETSLAGAPLPAFQQQSY